MKFFKMEATGLLVGFHCGGIIVSPQLDAIVKNFTLWTGVKVFVCLEMFVHFFWLSMR